MEGCDFMYKLLLNQTYLYLLQHQGEKLNQSEIGRRIGLNRKTVKKELDDIPELINYYNIVDFHNDISNKYVRALAIIKDIDDKNYTVSELARELDISEKTLAKYYSKSDEAICGVYGIFYNQKCIYIGFSKNVNERIEQHKMNIGKNLNHIKLYKYCKDNNIMVKDLDFTILAKSTDIEAMKQLESNLYRTLQPIGNEIIE